jgi:hypothetical protein
MEEADFWKSGIFGAAVERLRGIQAATLSQKREFMESIFGHLRRAGAISDWKFTGTGQRHDYEVSFQDGFVSVVETKGCLDGNNTNIFERPPGADEFVIWSLCQNAGADPRKNAWSGIHTRLGAEVIYRRQKVDGLVIWDMVCGTAGRPCPKLAADPNRATQLRCGLTVPPPCLYLFPRSVPDPRDNKKPRCLKLKEVRLLKALFDTFKADLEDVVEVHIEAGIRRATILRKTTFVRNGKEIVTTNWAALKRARP